MPKTNDFQRNVFSSERLDEASSELLQALVRCYVMASESGPDRYWAVVVELGPGGVKSSSVRSFESWGKAEDSPEAIFAGLYGFGPVSGDVEPHAWNWAEAVLIGFSMYAEASFTSPRVSRPSRPAGAKRRQPKGSLDGRS